MGLFDTLKKVGGVALGAGAGFASGGPIGAAVGGLGALSGGRQQSAQGDQLRQLQQQSFADRRARQPFQAQFGEGISAFGDRSAPDFSGQLGGTTAGQTGLIGQQFSLGGQSGSDVSRRLGASEGLFGDAGGGLDRAGQLFQSGSSQGIPGFQGIGAGSFQPGSGFQNANEQAFGQVGQALQAPGISDAAQGQLRNIFQQSEDARKIGSQEIGRNAAALGRTGSGVVNTQFGNLEERIQRGQNQSFRDLASQTAQADASNQLQRAQLGLGAAGQALGQDLGIAGFQQGLRGEARGERGNFLGDSFGRAGLDQSAGRGFLGLAGQGGQLGRDFGSLAGLGQGLDINALNDQRGERGFQAGLDQQQFQNRFGQLGAEQGAFSQDRAFELDRLRQLAGVGFGGPSGGIGAGDIGLLNNLTDQTNRGQDQQGALTKGLFDLIKSRQPAQSGPPPPNAFSFNNPLF